MDAFAPGLLSVAFAYLVGAVPFGYLVGRLVGKIDIRQHGSRNVGATNVARTFGKFPGILALLLDMAKGYGAVAFSRWLIGRPAWPLPLGVDTSPIHSRAFWVSLSALIAVLAHMYPVWLRFHGGKGVATATGAFLALSPVVIAAGAIVFVIVILITRFVSLASILSASSIPLFFRYLTQESLWTILVSIVIAITIILKHHSNIARLANGEERRMGDGKDHD